MTGDVREGPSVVVPAVGAPSSTCIVRSLGRRGVHTVVASERSSPPVSWSRYSEETVAVPSPHEDLAGYRDALLSLARRDDVEAITPVREHDAYLLARYRDEFEDHVATYWPSFDQTEAVHDRQRLFEAADRAGVPAPATERLDEVTDWERELIVKARYALLAEGYVGSMSEEEATSPPKTMYLDPGERPDVEDLCERMGHVPIVQEYVGGSEFTFRALYHEGEPMLTTQKRLLRGYKYPRGPSVSHEQVDIPELEAVGRALLDELEWHGPASLGFIRDAETNEFRLLEINPRFWANVSLDVHAGVDVPHYYWRLARGEPVEREPEPDADVATHLLRGQVAHMHSVLFEEYPMVERPSVAGTLHDVATSIPRHPRFDLLSLEDPGPFARDLLNAVGATLPSIPVSVDVDVSVGGGVGTEWGSNEAGATRSTAPETERRPRTNGGPADADAGGGDVAAETAGRSADVPIDEHSSR